MPSACIEIRAEKQIHSGIRAGSLVHNSEEFKQRECNCMLKSKCLLIWKSLHIYKEEKNVFFCFFFLKQRTPNPPSCNFLALCWLNDDWGKGPAYMVFYVFCVHPWRLTFLQVIAQRNFRYLRLKIHGSGFQLSPYEKVAF